MACGLAIGLVLAAAATWFIVALRANDIADAERELNNLSLILSEELDRRLQGLDLLQLGLIEHMQQLGIDIAGVVQATDDVFRRPPGSGAPDCRPAPHRGPLTARRRREADQLLPLLAGSGYRCPRPRLHQGAAGRNPPKTVISQPQKSKTTGQWTIYFSRRFEAPDGQLIGIVLSTIFTDYFEQLFSRVSLSDGSSFALFRGDGMLLVRYPHGGPRSRDDVRPHREFQSLACVAGSRRCQDHQHDGWQGPADCRPFRGTLPADDHRQQHHGRDPRYLAPRSSRIRCGDRLS